MIPTESSKFNPKKFQVKNFWNIKLQATSEAMNIPVKIK